MRPFLALLASCLVLLAGCFDPEYPQGLTCSATEPACPPGQECGADGICHPEGDGTGADAGVPGADGAPDAAAEGERLVLSPSDPTIDEGTALALTVTHIDESGESQDVTSQATWTTRDDAVAPRGIEEGALRVDGVAPGGAVLEVSFDGLTAQASIVVEEALEDIQLFPRERTLPIGTTGGFVATGIRADLTKRNAREDVEWVSSDESVAGVSLTGRIEPRAAGTTRIGALYDGDVVDEVDVEVIDVDFTGVRVSPEEIGPLIVGMEQQVFANALTADGDDFFLSGEVQWEIEHEPAGDNDGDVLELDLSRNVPFVVGLGEGSATLRATFDGIESDEIEAEVLPGDLAPDAMDVQAPESISTYAEPEFLRVLGDFNFDGEHFINDRVTLESSDPDALRIDRDRSRLVPVAPSDEPVEVEATWPVEGGDDVVAAAEVHVVTTPVSALRVEEGPFDGALDAYAEFGEDIEVHVTTFAHWTSSNRECAVVNNILGHPKRVTLIDESACEEGDVITAHYRGEEDSFFIDEILDLGNGDGGNGDGGNGDGGNGDD